MGEVEAELNPWVLILFGGFLFGQPLFAGSLPLHCEDGIRDSSLLDIRHSFQDIEGLREVRFQLFDQENGQAGGCSYSRRIIASYQTESVDQLERYAFVQWIRGCAYRTYTDVRSGPSHQFWTRRHLGRYGNLLHPEWVIDSETADPIYGSPAPDGTEPRHHFYLWNPVPGRFDLSRMRAYRRSRLAEMPLPELWIADTPNGASYAFPVSPSSVALEFRTCLHRVRDLPLTAADGTPDLPPALICHEWNWIRVFDSTSQSFRTEVNVPETCSDVERMAF